jgi:hypothetical protein
MIAGAAIWAGVKTAAGAAKKFATAVPIKVWLGIGAAVLFALFLLWVYSSGKDAGRAERDAQLANLESALVMARADNESNVAAIARLVKVNLELAEGRAVDQEAAAGAVAKVAKERDALAAELAKRRKSRGEIYVHDPSAAAWGRERVPVLVAAGLRE